jgi:xylulokinase
MEHDAGEAWLRGPTAALAELARPDARAVAISAVVPSMTAVGPGGWPVTPGLLYGDARGRRPGPPAEGNPAQSDEAVEFLRWTAGQAPEAASFWSAPAVANYALGGAGVIDFATAFTTHPLFTGAAWDDAICADCGARPDQMPRVEMMGADIGRITGTPTVLAAGSIDAMCEQLVAGADQEAPPFWPGWQSGWSRR